MLAMSIIFGILGPISNILFIKDWWAPLTVDGTSVGIVDSSLTGFAIGGVTAVLYEVFRHLTFRKSKKLLYKNEHVWFFLMVPISLLVFFGGFYIFHLNSFITSTFALFIPTVVILWRRPDLIVDAFSTGVLLVLVSMLVYSLVNFITPGWINEFWYWENTPKAIFLNVPIDDIAHYFFLGLFGGPLYLYWKGVRLRRATYRSSNTTQLSREKMHNHKKHKFFGPVFWIHLTFLLLAASSPFWLDWRLILLALILLHLQWIVLGGCYLTFWEAGRDPNMTFEYYYLRRIWPKLNKKKMKMIDRYIIPTLLVAFAFFLQTHLNFEPALKISESFNFTP